jgi:hypothetical protein
LHQANLDEGAQVPAHDWNRRLQFLRKVTRFSLAGRQQPKEV